MCDVTELGSIPDIKSAMLNENDPILTKNLTTREFNDFSLKPPEIKIDERSKFPEIKFNIKDCLESLLDVITMEKVSGEQKNVPVEKGRFQYTVILQKKIADGITVYDAVAEPGTVVTPAQHKSNNFIFVYKGSVKYFLKYGEQTKVYDLNRGRILEIPASIEHYAIFFERTFMIGIFYPPMEI